MTQNAHMRDTLPGDIRQQFDAPATARFLRSLPSLQVDHQIPDRFLELLAELDRTEFANQNSPKGRGA